MDNLSGIYLCVALACIFVGPFTGNSGGDYFIALVVGCMMLLPIIILLTIDLLRS